MSFEVLGVKIDALDHEQVSDQLRRWLNGIEQKLVVTPNPEFILAAQNDQAFRKIINQADLSLPDGVGLRFAVNALHDQDLEHRLTGVDTLRHLASLCLFNGSRLMLFGGRQGSAGRAAAALRRDFPGLDVLPVEPGEIVHHEGEPVLSRALIHKLHQFEPVVLAVGLGLGKQEKFLAKYLSDLPTVRIGIGVGGAFDMLAGDLPRAPRWMQLTGLEWLWRLKIEPQRYKRIWQAAFIFPLIVAWHTLRRRHFLRSCARVWPSVIKQIRSVD
jgi:N-acetylglucosaminyldiphosphoundecaprenol N-acetyl-beta-D-mannosaminyltransferase